MLDKVNPAGVNMRSSAGVRPVGGSGSSSSRPAYGSSEISDRVEISELAQLLGKYAQMPEIRADLVERIKAEIEAGTYETEDKVDQAVDSLLEDLLW